jgi:hypothetical protein
MARLSRLVVGLFADYDDGTKALIGLTERPDAVAAARDALAEDGDVRLEALDAPPPRPTRYRVPSDLERK